MWVEQGTKDRERIQLTEDKKKGFEDTKKELHPRIAKESEELKPFKTIEFQPVRSPKNYDAEFAVKDADVIFHFWPSGYHEAERSGRVTPRFGKEFRGLLVKALSEQFGEHRIEVEYDGDMGAYFAKAVGYAESLYHRDLSIKACQSLHILMGGEV